MPVSLVYPHAGLLPLKTRAFLNWITPRLRARLQVNPTRRGRGGEVRGITDLLQELLAPG